MDPKKLQDRLMVSFLAELEEHIRTMNRELLALEKGGEPDDGRTRIDALFRAAHTMKSASRAVGQSTLETAAHRLEGVMSLVRSGTLRPSDWLFQAIFAMVDRFQEAQKRLRAGQGIAAAFFDEAVGVLEAATREGNERRREGEQERTGGTPPTEETAAPDSAGRALGEGFIPPGTRPVAGTLRPPGASSSPATLASGASLPSGAIPSSGVGLAAPRGPGKEPEPAPAPWQAIRVEPQRLDDILVLSRELGQKTARLSSVLAEVDQVIADATGLDRDCRPVRNLAEGASKLGSRTGSPGHIRERVRSIRNGLTRLKTCLKADLSSVELALGQLEDEVQQLRMFPFGLACQGLDRVVRDLEKQFGREADLVVSGSEVEVDRAVLEGLRDPLIHLVRNALAHGIEPVDVRVAAGKKRRGTIRVSASLQRGQVQVVVEDDGHGIDLVAVRAAAERQGLSVDDPQALVRLLFRPGFTTTTEANKLSGRGVGLDVVRTRVEEVHGTVHLASRPGQGTTASILVPLTLTTVSALLVVSRGVCYAIPSAQVDRVLRASPEDLLASGSQTLLRLGEALLPVAPLCRLLDGEVPPAGEAGQPLPGIVLSVQGKSAVLLVEKLVEIRDILVRPMSPRLGRVRFLSGATLLPDGRVAPILHAPGLLDALTGEAPDGAWVPAEDTSRKKRAARLLLVDDSLTTRSLEKMILESAGYSVLVATDGAEAWDLLQRSEVDLVVADVQMPRLDGFGLTASIRSSGRLSELPVVLVTGLDSEEDRARGLEAGADAYIVKGAFDQGQLLETIDRLL